VEINSLEDSEKTGNFNISVEGNLIFNKHTSGEYNSQAKKAKVYEAILGELRKDGSNEPLIATIQIEDDDDDEKAGNRSVIVSLCTLLISIPALIGA